MGAQRFTATELARVTGKDRRSVHRALIDVPPATKVMVEGNDAAAWHLMDLPEDFRDAADPFDLRALADMVELQWKDPMNPTSFERARLLDCAFVKLEALIKLGANERTMKARQIAWLVTNAALAPNELAMRRTFNRYLDRWRKGGRKLSALHDARPKAAKQRRKPVLSKEEVNQIATAVVFNRWEAGGNNLYKAWANAWPKLRAEIRDNFPLTHEVPKRIRKQVLPTIEILQKQHRGPRHARLNGCYLERDWSNVFAGDWYSSDDITLPVYCYDPENPRELLRGQFLPMIDVKSERILDFAFEVSKSYTAATIRALISRVCARHGLPRKGFHFERGIWKNAKILGGGAKCEPWNDKGETFADRLGLRMMHSLPGNARAKIVERVAGILQDMMEGEPSYVGRNEMVDKFERVQKAKRDFETGRAETGFYSVAQWIARLEEICELYNARVRESEVMGGTMSPDEAWERCQARNSAGAIDPLVKLTPDLGYLLSAHKEVVSVTRAGIRLFNGKYRYASEVTGELQGQTVVAWFDPEHPETLAITDHNGENVRTIPRLHKIPAYDAWETSPELARESSAMVNAHNGYGRRLYSELKSNFFPPARALLADPGALQKGRDMDRQREDVKAAIPKKRTGAPENAFNSREEEAEFQRRLARSEQFQKDHALEFLT